MAKDSDLLTKMKTNVAALSGVIYGTHVPDVLLTKRIKTFAKRYAKNVCR